MLQFWLLFAVNLTVCLISEAHVPAIVRYHIWEEQPAGTKVGRLLDELRQRGETGSLEDFRVVEHGQALPFIVATRDGEVSTLSQLDRENLCHGDDHCELEFNVLFRKGGAVHFLRVRVEVMDLNDHSPAFSNPVQEVEISETVGLRMRILLDRAEDPDAGPNGLQTYSLSPNQHFALDVRPSGGTKQPELVVIKELDRERQSFFELTLVAWDKGNPPKSGSTKVQVIILDSNDNSPVFEESALKVELPEDTVRGTVIVNLHATDPDQGANGEVEYSLSKHAPLEVQRLFTVDPQTGSVAIKGPLDFEEKQTYEVDIQAKDRGHNAIPSHCKLQIRLQDINDNAPRIHVTWTPPDSSMATVSEGASDETFLALVMVSDADSGSNGEVQAYIQHGSGPFLLKQIHGDNYMIVTNGSLDREQQMEYNITLLARDNGVPSLSCVRHLTVRVLDENDNAPVFSKTHYKGVFKENNVPGYHVLTLKAHDADLDLSGRVSYSIRESNELGTATASFSVHPTSGAVIAQKSLDYEESPTYSFIVEAIDHGYPPLTSSATVIIEVLDVNDNHPVINEPLPKKGIAVVSVPVNAEKGEIVAEIGVKFHGTLHPKRNHSSHHRPEGFLATTILASDPDSGLNGRLCFRIADGNPSRLFWLDETTGQLYVNTTNATELIGKAFKLAIEVSDMGTPTLVTRTTLEVTFINLRDHLKNSSPGHHAQFSFTVLLAICLGGTCLLLLLTVALVTTFCRPEKRDNHAYNCRQAESSYTSHPRRPQKHIHKTDIQLVPVLRGRRDDPPNDEAQPLTAEPPLPEDARPQGQLSLSPLLARMAQSQARQENDGTLSFTQSKTLRKPGSIDLDCSHTPASPYRTLRKARNPSASSSSHSQTSTLRRNKPEEVITPTVPLQVSASEPFSQATLRRQKNSERNGRLEEQDHRQILRNLVRLSMAALGDNSIELSSASPEVQQVSQLLSLLHQGQLQPRPNFRGNKYFHRSGRSGVQDADWLSTKDSGHGESEPGDVDWEAGRESPVDPLLEEGLKSLLNNPDDVFTDVPDPAWMARLSLPLTSDYHENLYVPDGLPSPDGQGPTLGSPDDSASFSTFGKTPENSSPLGGEALLSEVSTLFEMLLTQKADAQPRPPADILYRLSTAYRRSLGLDMPPGGGSSSMHHPGPNEKQHTMHYATLNH
ncbi:protocadherin-12 isoform X1 [Electrophorus electricus]|uniref:protocadherin-12 isoform X1 n=1 Tax=Electrophorus electricus TaxID=8005 RepID=UPI0015D059FE|nr:protocadherin-12 isoform X1 [Electrophorus electricus]